LADMLGILTSGSSKCRNWYTSKWYEYLSIDTIMVCVDNFHSSDLCAAKVLPDYTGYNKYRHIQLNLNRLSAH